ncbi:MAG: gliding motility-associated C-terminal domain-containing protein [Prevotella sp.]|nr:gliding motility-associated C-terminal domain-containing protein [Prevotella sp.]
MPIAIWATITPTAIYTDKDGKEITETREINGDAPLHVRFMAYAESLEAGSSLEWHFIHVGSDGTSEITRYEENTEFDFRESGKTTVMLLVKVGDEVVEEGTITVNISDSHLEMPNAFSPNGDGYNKIYGAKGVCNPESTGRYRSIVEFHAYIFNRWGQKLYEWTDISSGWDGTYNGSPVKDGVYYVLVNARGADGKVYNIRRDVNLIRNFNSVTSTGGE